MISPAVLRRLDDAPPLRRALECLVSLDVADRESYLSATRTQGIARYDADELWRLLQVEGQVSGDQLDAQSHERYRAMLQPPKPEPEPERSVGGRLPSEMPREKLLREGADSLSDQDLIAIFLRTGQGSEDLFAMSQRILNRFEGLPGLAQTSMEELQAEAGLGPAKAAQIVAAFALARRMAVIARRERIELRSPEQIFEAFAAEMLTLDSEEFWCLPLDSRTCLIGAPRRLNRGDVDGTDAGVRKFFRSALAAKAVQVIALHNHPSGDAQPSPADQLMTRRLVAAGRLLDIPLADHCIFGAPGQVISLRRMYPEIFR